MPEADSVQSLLVSARNRLAEAGCDTPALDAEILLAHTLGQERTWLYVHPQAKIALEQLAAFNRLLQRRVRREPVAYLVGSKEFFGLEFQVNRHVLIPRPETELLVEIALDILKDRCPADDAERPTEFIQSKTCSERSRRTEKSKPVLPPRDAMQSPAEGSKVDIVDVGTGSGCIAIALAATLPNARLVAIDASADALALAHKNAGRHHVAGRITFLTGDLLHPLDRPVDLIVSNPPYVSRSELRAVSPEIGQYEPRLALEGGDDGLEVIRQLLLQAKEKLRPGGALLVEIGSPQGPAAAQLAREAFPTAGVSVKRDLAELDRLLVVRS